MKIIGYILRAPLRIIAAILALFFVGLVLAQEVVPELPNFDAVLFAESATALGGFLIGFTAFVRHFWLQALDGIWVPVFVVALGAAIGLVLGTTPITGLDGAIPGLLHGLQAGVAAVLIHIGLKSAMGGSSSAEANTTHITAARLKR